MVVAITPAVGVAVWFKDGIGNDRFAGLYHDKSRREFSQGLSTIAHSAKTLSKNLELVLWKFAIR